MGELSPLQTLGFTLGTSFASGVNVYATVAAAGLFQRLGIITLPAKLQILASPLIIGIAAVMFVIEFVADKVPIVDSAWDAVHTFIRPPAAALMGYAAFASVPEAWQLAAALLAGSVALTSHGAKASLRAAANTSPEPFSNWTLSALEDLLVVFLSWLASTHPLATGVLVLVLLVVAILVMRKLFRYLRRVTGRFREPAGGTGSG